MDVGLICPYNPNGGSFKRLQRFGLSCCQLNTWNPEHWTAAHADKVKKERDETGSRISAIWAGWTGEQRWNFTEGPLTLGLVPEKTRASRVADYKKAAAWTKSLGVQAMITHLGYIPENLTDPLWPGVLAAVKEIGSLCADLGIGFWFETGQETPVVLLRLIEETGLKNLGINLDPANLILYGKGNPVDALDVFGPWVRNVHTKDGFYPTTGRELGREVAVGKGKVDFPRFIRRLKEVGFDAELIIEREIPEGPEQDQDIRETIAHLRRWASEA